MIYPEKWNILSDILCIRPLDQKEKRKARLRVCSLLLFFLIIGMILLFSQCVVEEGLQSGTISEDFVNITLKFSTHQITPTDVFLSSYIHRTDDNRSHLENNLHTYAVYATFIVLFVVLRECTKFPLPPHYYHWLIGILFIAFPLLFACIFKLYDIFLHQDSGMVCCGFSGIAFSLIGVFTALLLHYLVNALSCINSHNKLIALLQNHVLILICGIILSFFFALPIGLYNGNHSVHIAGLIGGFIVAYSLEILLKPHSQPLYHPRRSQDRPPGNRRS